MATGKTPEATMASALFTDVKRKGTASAFVRPAAGLFGLREWAALGDSHSQVPWLCSSCV